MYPHLSTEPWSVTELTARIKSAVESRPDLNQVAVTGELSTVGKKNDTWYFLLKDARSSIRCILFKSDARHLSVPLANGQAVTITGRVGVFEMQGQTQLYVHTVTLIGEGAARAALEALYRRLKAEGVLTGRKRPLPLLPQGIAVVTSTTGAVRHDIDQVTERRFPGFPRYVVGTNVQGTTAAASIVSALRRAAAYPVSVIILARGGGSKEDLMAFNDESVVRAVAASPIPVISAIGHGIDQSLTDLAADYQAATPSQAAEMAVPVLQDLLRHHRDLQHRATQAMDRVLTTRRQHWTLLTSRPVLTDPSQLWAPHRQRLDQWQERLDRAWDHQWTTRTHHLALLQQRLAAFDPLAILRQGYAYASADLEPNAPVLTAASVQPGRPFVVRWHDGHAWVTPDRVQCQTTHPATKERGSS